MFVWPLSFASSIYTDAGLSVLSLTLLFWLLLLDLLWKAQPSVRASPYQAPIKIILSVSCSFFSFFSTFLCNFVTDVDAGFVWSQLVAVQVWALTVEKWANSTGNSSEINELWLHGRCLTLRSTILDFKDDLSICGCDRYQPYFTEPIYL